MGWIQCGLRIGLLMWLLPEFGWCEATPEELELSGGEMHLGAVKVPEVRMLTPEEMHQLHGIIDLDGNGALSLIEALEHSKRLDRETILDEFYLAKEYLKDGKLSLNDLLTLDELDTGSVGFESDGAQDATEAAGVLRGLRFEHADKDGDGHLDEAELTNFYSPAARDLALAEVSLAKKDQDRSGRLSKLEFFSEPGSAYIVKVEGELMDQDHATFRELDKDGSGDIDLQELTDWESGRFHAKAELAHMVANADLNQDGEISAEEFVGARDSISNTSAMFHLLEWHARQEL